jgi:hypothetical protein
VACDLILYLLLLKEKEDDFEPDCPYGAPYAPYKPPPSSKALPLLQERDRG